MALFGWAVMVLIAVVFILLALGMLGASVALNSGETLVMGIIFGLLGYAFAYGAWVNVPFEVAMKVASG